MERDDDGRVTYAESRELEPEDEDGLEGEIPGEVVEHETKGKGLCEVEEAEDDPVREPLDVVLSTWRFDGLEGKIGREGPADEIAHGRGEGVDEEKKAEKSDTANGNIRLGHLCALLEGGEDWVLGKLREITGHISAHSMRVSRQD